MGNNNLILKFLFCIFVLITTVNSGFSQFGEGVVIQKVKSVYIREADSTASGIGQEADPFPNLNTTRFYYDKKNVAAN